MGLTVHPLTHAVLRGIYTSRQAEVTTNLRDTDDYLRTVNPRGVPNFEAARATAVEALQHIFTSR
jgi:hypothetical protein